MSAVAAAVPEPDPESMSGLGSGVRRAAPTDAGFGLDERASLELCLADPTTFDAGTVLEFLVRVRAEESRWAAKRVRLLADLAARDPSDDRWVAEEVGAALRWSPTRAMRAVKEASQLHDQLPATFARLAAGVLTPRQATLVTEASYRLPDRDSVAALDQAAATHCGDKSEPETRRFVNRQVLRADPGGAERRHQQAAKDRHVRLTAADDGMALLSALLPAPEAVACFQRLDTAARRHRQAHRSTPGAQAGQGAAGRPADPRTMDQLRADLFTRALLNTGARTADTSDDTGDRVNDAGAGFGLGASVQVIVSAATLLGQDDEPGWLDRYGPITADTARRIAHDGTGTWRRLVTDPVTGQLTDVGTKRYRPPAAVRRHVELRDGTCRFPYCSHPATGCDLDHVVPYPEGPTSVDNLHAVSRRHHRAKTHTRWRVSLDPATGETTWTSPTGRKRTTRPPQRWTLPGDTPTAISAENRQPPAGNRDGAGDGEESFDTGGDLPEGDLPDGDLPDGDLPDGDVPDEDATDGDLPDSRPPDSPPY